jgi:hypothetical protein
MDGDLDINKVVAEFIEARLDNLVDGAQSVFKGARLAVRSRLDRTYTSYLSRILDRYSKSKSFFIRSQPTPLYDFFVPLDLATDRFSLNRPGAPDIAEVAQCSLLTGSGGGGKSMLMRHLLISAMQSRSKVPIFVELRGLNQNDMSVRELLLKTLQDNTLAIDDLYLEVALKAGHFYLLLDGFDELELRRRKRVASEVRQLSDKYHKNWLVMSSRPDQELQGWTDFTQFDVQPLDLDRAIELVAKLPFDDPVRDRFMKDLQGGLFDRHKSFLSNPLLLSIMLLTYSENASIPTKLSIFYQQAYEALFQKHDALKGGYQREHRSELDVQDFAKQFAAFCLLSYDKRMFSFSRVEALDALDRAQLVSGLAVDAGAFLDDAIQAVCLMVEEGLAITFAHRSFQEYFVARFVSHSPPETRGQLVRRFAPSIERDSVMSLLFEMDPYSVERYYILPGFDRLREHMKLKKTLGISHYLRFLQRQISSFEVEEGEGEPKTMARINDTSQYFMLAFVRRISRPNDPMVWPEQDIRAFRDVIEAEGAAGNRIDTQSLAPSSPLVKFLFNLDSHWGGKVLQRLLDAEDEIRNRHQTAEASLEQILQKR